MKRVIPFVLVLMCSVASAVELPATALAADPLFMAKVAGHHGMTLVRFANQPEDRIRQMVLDYLEAQRTSPSDKAETREDGVEPAKASSEARQ